MTLKGLFLGVHLCAMIFPLVKCNDAGYKIVYRILCDDDRLVSLSYNLMDGQTEVFPKYIEIEEHGIVF